MLKTTKVTWKYPAFCKYYKKNSFCKGSDNLISKTLLMPYILFMLRWVSVPDSRLTVNPSASIAWPHQGFFKKWKLFRICPCHFSLYYYQILKKKMKFIQFHISRAIKNIALLIWNWITKNNKTNNASKNIV